MADNKFSYYDTLYDYTPSKSDVKKETILNASETKKGRLTNYTAQDLKLDMFGDADNLTLGGVNTRLSTNEPGSSFDAFETRKPEGYWEGKDPKAVQKKLKPQFKAAAQKFGIPLEEVTLDHVNYLGDIGAAELKRLALEDQINYPLGTQEVNEVSMFDDRPDVTPARGAITVPMEGPMQVDPNVPRDEFGTAVPQIEYAKTGEGYFGRPLAKARNPITGKDLIAAMSGPEYNAAFGSKYNVEGRKDYTKKQKLEENIAKLKGEFRDDSTILSDEFVKTVPGKISNTAGAFISGMGRLDDAVLSTPEFVSSAISGNLDGFKEILKEKFPDASKKVSEMYEGSLLERTVNTAKADMNFITDSLDKLGDVIEKGTGYFYNKSEEGRVAKEAGQAYEDSEGVVDGIKNMVGVAVDNPVVAGQTFINSLPEMLALTKKGAAGAGAFVSLVGDRVEASKEEFEKQHGKEPDADELAYMYGTSLVATGIDKVESLFILGKPIAGKMPSSATIDGLKVAFQKTAEMNIVKGISKVPGLATAAKGTAAGFTEAAQEATQTGLEKLGGIQDIQKTIADPKVRKEAYVAATLGMGAGGLGGGAVQAVKDTGVVAEGTKAVAGKAKEKVKSTAKSYVEGKQDKVIVDPKAEGYDSQAAFDVTIEKGTRDTDAATHKQDVITHSKELMNDIGIELDKVELKLKDAPADPNLAVEKKNLQTKRTEVIGQIKKEMQLIANQIANESVASTLSNPKEATEAQTTETNKAILSSDRFGSEDLDRIIATKDMPAAIVESAKIRKAFNEVESRINTKEVQAQILQNKKKNLSGKRSVTLFKDEFKAALDSGDINQARSLYKEMGTWRGHQADKLSKLQNLKPGETVNYGDNNKFGFTLSPESNPFYKASKQGLDKLVGTVKLELDYMDKYLALMGKSGKERFKQAPVELDIENLEVGISEDYILSNLGIETPIEAPVESVAEAKPETDTITPPTATKTTEEKPVSTPVKESVQEKAVPITGTKTLETVTLEKYPEIAQYQMKDDSGNIVTHVAENLAQVVKLTQDRMTALNKVKECL